MGIPGTLLLVSLAILALACGSSEPDPTLTSVPSLTPNQTPDKAAATVETGIAVPVEAEASIGANVAAPTSAPTPAPTLTPTPTPSLSPTPVSALADALMLEYWFNALSASEHACLDREPASDREAELMQGMVEAWSSGDQQAIAEVMSIFSALWEECVDARADAGLLSAMVQDTFRTLVTRN